jgi:hypothetical protein
MKRRLERIFFRLENTGMSYDEISYVLFGDYTGKNTDEEKRAYIVDCLNHIDVINLYGVE